MFRITSTVIWLLIASLVVGVARAEPLFSNPELAGGGSPRWVAAGDFDADGDLDFAVGNDFGTQVAVILNRGDSLPSLTTLYEVGVSPRHVVVADIDGDGDLDVIASNNGAASLTLLANDGFGNFTDATSGATQIATANQPNEIVFADFDGDLVNDIAVGVSGGVRVHRGLGAGTYDAGTSYGSGLGFSVASTDVDDDGDLDLVYGLIDQTLLRNDGSGGFVSAGVLATGPIDAAFGDLDGDGDPDLVLADRSANRIGVLLGTGGVYGAPSWLAVGKPQSVLVADLDGDGDLDIAAGDTVADRVAIFRNDGTASFGAAQLARVETSPVKLIAGDWNGDGSVDLAVASQQCFTSSCSAGSLGLLLADALGQFSSSRNMATVDEPRGLAAVDVDADGRVDLVAAIPAVDFAEELINQGDGSLLSSGSIAVSAGGLGWPDDVELADLDGDGAPDFAAAAFRSGYVTLAQNNAGGAFAPGVEFSVPHARTFAVELGDMDGDLDRDLVVASGFAGVGAAGVSVYLNDGTGSFPGPGRETAIADEPNDLALGDIDGDADIDAVTVHFAEIDVLLGDGAGTLAAPTTLALAGGAIGVAVSLADLDGDGDLDLAVGTDAPDQVLTFRNDGTGSFVPWRTLVLGTDPFEILAEDFDADGDVDLAVANVGITLSAAEDGGNVSLLLNDGAGNLAENGRFFVGLLTPLSSTGPPTFGGEQLAALDVDGDGDLDLAVSNPNAPGVSILTNRLVTAERASGVVAMGGTLGTDSEADGATFADPVETLVTSPNVGDVEIIERAITDVAHSGWRFLGQEVVVTAPVASSADPLVLEFRVDSSRIPASGAGTVHVFKDGLLVAVCMVAPPTALPDPCVEPVSVQADGDAVFRVRSSTASAWNFGVARPIQLNFSILLTTPFGNASLLFQIEDWRLELLLESLADTNQNGMDEMSGSGGSGFAEVVVQDALLGTVKLRLRDSKLPPFQSTVFQLEETSGQIPGLLELPPFAAVGGGQAGLNLYVELEVQQFQALMHNEVPIQFNGLITQWPPLPSALLSAATVVDLVDGQGQPIGVQILNAEIHASQPPAPPAPVRPVPTAVPSLAPTALLALAIVLALSAALFGVRFRSAAGAASR